MKIPSFFTKGWLRFCLLPATIFFSCGSLKQTDIAQNTEQSIDVYASIEKEIALRYWSFDSFNVNFLVTDQPFYTLRFRSISLQKAGMLKSWLISIGAAEVYMVKRE